MRFNPEQATFQRFARHLKEGFSRVVVWAGAGVSKPGNCPDWSELLTYVRRQALIKAEALDAPAKQLVGELVGAADNASSYWEKFSILKKALGATTFPIIIREAFGQQAKTPPCFYSEMWQMGAHGYITTNLDRFATRAATTIVNDLCEFDGTDSRKYAWILRKPQRFVLNVHGRLDAESSWVLTSDDLGVLKKLPEYWALLESLFRDCVILFAGCSPEDVSVQTHLERLKQTNLSLEGHYWLTHRNDQAAVQWGEKHGLARIHFDASDQVFDGVDHFLRQLKSFTGREDAPPIVVPPVTATPSEPLPRPDLLRTEPSVNKVRQVLNAEAKRILTSGRPASEIKKEYTQFTCSYEEALHRAWFISASAGAELFDLQIYQTVKKGAFGQVYEAIDPQGRRVAVKVLHGNIKDDPTMMTCFRRGVEAMRLLAEYKVDGAVPYLKAWEIPTCAVMEFIDGVNLQEAVERGQVKDWHEILRVSQALAKIIKSAHATPAGVLHRDLRPANIMLDSKDEHPSRKVLVLDFDLCWHHNASDPTSLHLTAEANNGYLSPEQLDPALHHLTRRPLVDSFGLGMVFYYLIARKHPTINQYMFKSWQDTLTGLALDRTCNDWLSAPMRYVRLIQNCTLHEQSARWDVARILGEAELLLDAVTGKRRRITAEFLAEEVFCRVSEIKRSYEWLPDQHSLRFRPRDGFEIILQWNESDKAVALKLQWLQTGSFHFEKLKKYIPESKDAATKALRVGHWTEVGTSLTTGGLLIDAILKADIAIDDADISKAACALGSTVESLRKLATRAR